MTSANGDSGQHLQTLETTVCKDKPSARNRMIPAQGSEKIFAQLQPTSKGNEK
ncbi:hypothetical protein GCM10009621_18100 [Corynebacterium felinum]